MDCWICGKEAETLTPVVYGDRLRLTLKVCESCLGKLLEDVPPWCGTRNSK